LELFIVESISVVGSLLPESALKPALDPAVTEKKEVDRERSGLWLPATPPFDGSAHRTGLLARWMGNSGLASAGQSSKVGAAMEAPPARDGKHGQRWVPASPIHSFVQELEGLRSKKLDENPSPADPALTG
jgi:hypothetical protein